MSTKKCEFEKYITITLTQTCNLSCTYCYENHKSKKYMSPETAFSIIDKELSKYDERYKIELDLFGGEPFVKFDTIKSIVDYVRLNYSHLNITVFISTNGTLLNDEIKNWCIENKDLLFLGLSYDGTAYMQDINRSNSSKYIDLDFFKENYPNQTIKMTISKETLRTLAEGVIYLHEKGFEVACNLAYSIDWSDPENKQILYDELNKLIEYYLMHLDTKPCTMLDDAISPIAYTSDEVTVSCGAGWSMVSYDVDGVGYPCQFFMPLAIGEEKAQKAKELKFYDETIPNDCLKKECISCILKSVCAKCLGSNYLNTGNLYHQDMNMCKLTKIIYKARAYFKAKLFECGVYDDLSHDDLILLCKSIEMINENLEID